MFERNLWREIQRLLLKNTLSDKKFGVSYFMYVQHTLTFVTIKSAKSIIFKMKYYKLHTV